MEFVKIVPGGTVLAQILDAFFPRERSTWNKISTEIKLKASVGAYPSSLGLSILQRKLQN